MSLLSVFSDISGYFSRDPSPTPESATPESSTPESATPESSTPESSTPELSTPESSIGALATISDGNVERVPSLQMRKVRSSNDISDMKTALQARDASAAQALSAEEKVAKIEALIAEERFTEAYKLVLSIDPDADDSYYDGTSGGKLSCFVDAVATLILELYDTDYDGKDDMLNDLKLRLIDFNAKLEEAEKCFHALDESIKGNDSPHEAFRCDSPSIHRIRRKLTMQQNLDFGNIQNVIQGTLALLDEDA